jgi:hypothetical protein
MLNQGGHGTVEGVVAAVKVANRDTSTVCVNAQRIFPAAVRRIPLIYYETTVRGVNRCRGCRCWAKCQRRAYCSLVLG